MTNQQHSITPPPELVQQWVDMPLPTKKILVIASQWGADQELEACCEWLCSSSGNYYADIAVKLRAARRPKPPSLKELALARLTSLEELAESMGHSPDDTIRRALEALPE